MSASTGSGGSQGQRPAPGPPLRPAVLALAPHLQAARKAREHVGNYCRALGAEEDLFDTAVLLTSELVTNAILHGRSLTRLVVTSTSTGLRVEVGDDNSRHPMPAQPDLDALDGRGISIIELLATAWGVRDEAIGKTVWFELTMAMERWPPESMAT